MTPGAQARYQEMDLLTMPAEKRVVFLYTQLLVQLRFARASSGPAAIEERSERLLRAQTIVNELLVSLDHEHGGPIAAQLAGLYAFFLRELMSVRGDDARLDRLIDMAAQLHAAWDVAATQALAAQRSAVGA